MPRMTRKARIAALIAELDAREQETPEQKEARLEKYREKGKEDNYRYGYKMGTQEYHRHNDLSFCYSGMSQEDRKIFMKGYRDGQKYVYGYYGVGEDDMPARRDRMSLEEREESRKGGY